MKKLVAMDAHWIPQEPGHSLYIRPTLSAPYPMHVRYRLRSTPILVSWNTNSSWGGATIHRFALCYLLARGPVL